MRDEKDTDRKYAEWSITMAQRNTQEKLSRLPETNRCGETWSPAPFDKAHDDNDVADDYLHTGR